MVNKSLIYLLNHDDWLPGKWQVKLILAHFRNPQRLMKTQFDFHRSDWHCSSEKRIYTSGGISGRTVWQWSVNIFGGIICRWGPSHTKTGLVCTSWHWLHKTSHKAWFNFTCDGLKSLQETVTFFKGRKLLP